MEKCYKITFHKGKVRKCPGWITYNPDEDQQGIIHYCNVCGLREVNIKKLKLNSQIPQFRIYHPWCPKCDSSTVFKLARWLHEYWKSFSIFYCGDCGYGEAEVSIKMTDESWTSERRIIKRKNHHG